MPLTDTACRHARCPEGKARARFADSGGLYLEVLPNGGKYWRMKYRVVVAGRRSEIPDARGRLRIGAAAACERLGIVEQDRAFDDD